jgi:hypothetical protein
MKTWLIPPSPTTLSARILRKKTYAVRGCAWLIGVRRDHLIPMQSSLSVPLSIRVGSGSLESRPFTSIVRAAINSANLTNEMQ